MGPLQVHVNCAGPETLNQHSCQGIGQVALYLSWQHNVDGQGEV